MGKKRRSLPAKSKEKSNIVPVGYRMKRINAKNILGITPNELYGTWDKNKRRMEEIINSLKIDILQLQNRLNMVEDRQRVEIIREIKRKKEEIKECEGRFKNWINELEGGINTVVHKVFEKLLSGASKNDISSIVIEFSNTFSEARYGNEKLENILIRFIEDYKSNAYRRNMKQVAVQSRNTSVQTVNPTYKPYKPYETGVIDSFPDTYYEGIGEIENIRGRNDIDKLYDNKKHKMRFFSISIFYGSYGDKKSKNRELKNKPISNMLLGALDAMSSFLYGNIQNALDELYDDEK